MKYYRPTEKSSMVCSLLRRAAIFGLLTLVTAPQIARGQAITGISPVSYQLVRSQRFDRTRFDYVYRVVVRNASAAFAADVAGSVTSTAPASVVVDPAATFGDIPSESNGLSADTITIRQDRLLPFNAAAFQWTFSGATVTGATPPADPGANGKLTLDGIDSNTNGVRDDVERWVLIQFPSISMRAALLEHARMLQSALAQATDTTASGVNGARLVRSVHCMYLLTNATGKNTIDELTARFVNTRARLDAYQLFDRNMQGRTYSLVVPGQQAPTCAATT